MYLLFTILAILAIPFIMALFIKNEYSIERSIQINKPKSFVFSYIKYLKNQNYYSKWVMMDPNMDKEYKGEDGTVGFRFAWEGNKQAGKGEQEIINLKEDEKIEHEIRFERPFKSIAYTQVTTKTISESQTRVIWGMKGRSNYPMNIMNLFMDKMLGKDMATSLTALKNILEK